MIARWLMLSILVNIALPTIGMAQSNGLEGEDQDTWNHLSQGTEFFPLTFLVALKDADTGEPFMKNLDRFGFVPDPRDPKKNPYGLPVGMTADTTRDLRFSGVIMVGVNCAACHTAVLELGGLPVLRADGGTNIFDADGFRVALKRSVQKVLDNPVELIFFVSRLLHNPLHNRSRLADANRANQNSPLVSKVEAAFDLIEGSKSKTVEQLQDLIRMELQQKPFDLTRGIITRPDDPNLKSAKAKIEGLAVSEAVTRLGLLPATDFSEVLASLRLLRARLEAFNVGSNPITTPGGPGRVDAFGAARNKLFPDNQGTLDAPVRYPFIWTIKELHWYHWDGNTQSILERNIGEAIGVGAIVDPSTHESTIRFDNLAKLETIARKLTPPRWPEEFGVIDTQKAAKGAQHFNQYCARCHVGPNIDGSKIVPLTDATDEKKGLNTDPRRVKNVRRKVGDQGFFDVQTPILRDVLRKGGIQPEGIKNLWRPSKENDPDLAEGYPMRPLPAFWASPPFLHNGSVPNLYQLLLPAEQRAKVFPMGHREYDTKNLGYTLDPARTVFVYDTRRPGNSNSGHSGSEYGTDANQLTEEQRWELIEYLKTR